MNDKIREDLAEMKKKLSEYIDKGRVVGYREVREEPVIAIKPDKSKIKPLRKMKSCDVHFLAVDCSTRTLKRAHNWGIYLFRTAYALVRGRDVDWGYDEEICTEIGDAHTRSNALIHRRTELESKMALKFLYDEDPRRSLDKENYILLDGASFFGGKRRFSISLYEESRRRNINLLCVSKQSSTLHDEKGRDFIAVASTSSSYPIWVYHPVKEANKDEHRYGDISIVKLCEDSPRAFRCDIMEYLTNREVSELLSPLSFLSEDPRCLGYPVTLWLAHDFSAPSDSKLLHYHDQIEETLASADLLDILRMEELSCNFPDELHGVKHAFQWEWIERV
jgi:hypothetical protein